MYYYFSSSSRSLSSGPHVFPTNKKNHQTFRSSVLAANDNPSNIFTVPTIARDSETRFVSPTSTQVNYSKYCCSVLFFFFLRLHNKIEQRNFVFKVSHGDGPIDGCTKSLASLFRVNNIASQIILLKVFKLQFNEPFSVKFCMVVLVNTPC